MPTPLLQLIASVMEAGFDGVDENSDSTTLAKWDSMRQIMLASMLESEYAFTLSNDDLMNLNSVKNVRDILAAHGVKVE